MQVIKLKHFTDCIFKKINFCYYENVYNMERSFMPDTVVFILVSLYIYIYIYIYVCVYMYVCVCVCALVRTCGNACACARFICLW
jgi:hypothetical protein